MKTALTLFFTLVLCYSGTAHGQITGTTAGMAPFGSYTDDPTGVVNAANLNLHTVIPIRTKGAFFFNLQHENTLWTKGTCVGQPCWVMNWNPNFGPWGRFNPVSTTTGVPLPTRLNAQCANGLDAAWSFQSVDAQGFLHSYTLKIDNQGCTYPVSGSATDVYGYTVTATALAGSAVSASITDPSGNVSKLTGATSNPTFTDPNGNSVTQVIDSVSAYHYTDPTGSTPLSESNPNTPTPVFSYTDASGNPVNVTISATNYNIKTNFGCSGILEAATQSASLVTNISLPDGSHYGVTYEPTPGSPSYTTGRVASISLPTGGTVTYSYNGPNDGLTCSDYGTSGFTRTTSDGTWTYSRTFVSGQWKTTITSPSGQKVTYLFTGGTGNGATLEHEVQRTYAEANGTVVSTVATCYNGNVTLATCATQTSIGGTIPTEITVFTGLPTMGGRVSEVDTLYDSSSRETQRLSYDFGSAAPGALLQNLITAYGTWNGSACLAIGNNIIDRVCSKYIVNGSTTIAKTLNGYDPKGNVLSAARMTSPGNYPFQSFSHNANGTVATATDFNTTVTTYSNYLCNGMYPGTISAGGLTTYSAYDCNGGVQTSSTDANGSVTSADNTTSGADPFWRPKGIIDPLGTETDFAYQPTSVASSLTFGGSVVASSTTTDALGRALAKQRQQAPGSANYDTASYTYDSNGRQKTVSLPCVVALGATCPTSATTTTYDAVGRPLTVTDAGGGTFSYSYSTNDVLVTRGPAPIGENTKSRQLEFDGLGRLTSVCEVTSATGSGSCGQNTAATGYVTRYSYNAMGLLTQVAQGTSQTRSYAYDGVGRLTSETNPEGGTTQYFYDSAPSTPGVACPGSYSGDLVKKYDANGNTTCFAYDGLHRMLSTTFSGPNSNGANRYFVYDGAVVNGQTMTAPKGRMAEAYTATCQTCSKVTDLGFGYTARGEVANVYESTPHSGGYYSVGMTYWPNGHVNTLSGLGFPTFTYALDSEGRTGSVFAMTGQNPVTNTVYNTAGQVTSVTYGSGDSDSFSFDPNTGRENQYQLKMGALSDTGVLTWNANGSLAKLAITDQINTADTQTCTYLYDDLGRVGLPPGSTGKSVDCGSTKWQQNFSFDPFGNITKTVPTGGTGTSFMPGYSTTTNRFTSLPGLAYDANGNLLNDSFHTYSWDATSNPIQLDTVTVVYDALGRMVELQTPSYNTEWVYSPTGEKLELMLFGQTFAGAWVPLPGGGRRVYQISNGTVSGYTHSDWLGSARLVTSDTQTLISDVAYAPYGEDYAVNGGYLQFTEGNLGQLTVAGGGGHGLFDFDFRKYSPLQGRWISPDPAGLQAVDPTNPQSWNRYTYVMNSPLAFTDPTGLAGNSSGFDSCTDPKIRALCSPSQVPGNPLAQLGSDAALFGTWDQFDELEMRVKICLGDCGYYAVGYVYTVLSGTVGGMPNLANNGPDPNAVANSMKQYVKAQISNCYNGFHQTTFGKVVQAFSALALFPVASNSQSNQLTLGAEVLGKLSVAAGSNSAGAVFTPLLEAFTAEVTTPLYIMGTGADTGAYLLCAAGGATSIHP